MVLIKKKKKLSPEELEAQRREKELKKSGIQDEFQAKGFELVDWVQHHKPRILFGLAALVCLLVVWLGSSVWFDGSKMEAAADYEAALKLFEKAQAAQGEEKTKVSEEALESFQKILTEYGEGAMAKAVYIQMGDLSLSSGNNEKAIEAFENAIRLMSKADLLRQVAMLGLATSYESDSQAGKALETYEKMLESEVKIDEPMLLWQAQRLAKEIGQESKANEFIHRLLSDPNKPTYAFEISVGPTK